MSTVIQQEKKAAEEWMKNEMGAQKQEQKIQKRIAEKFRIQIKQKGQTIRDIFIAFDEDGGGTIDHEELRDGFAALGVRLNDREFTMMLKIWDKNDEGEIEFDVFADMFEKTLLVLEVDDTKREQVLAEEDAKEEARANIIKEIQKGGYGYRELVIRCDGHALASQPASHPASSPSGCGGRGPRSRIWVNHAGDVAVCPAGQAWGWAAAAAAEPVAH